MARTRSKPGEARAAITEYLRQHQPCGTQQIADARGVTYGSTYITLRTMADDGAVWMPSRGLWALDEWDPPGGRAAPLASLPPIPSLDLQPPPRAKATAPTSDFGELNLIEVAAVLNRWLAGYTGPANEPIAVEIVLSLEHLKRAIELRDERLKPLLEAALATPALVS